MNRYLSSRFLIFGSIALVLPLLFVGCGGGSTTTNATFTPSNTPASPGLVKLVQKARSGARVSVEVRLFGPEPDLDLNAFKFAIKIDDPNLLKFVPQSSYDQTALVPAAGQTIAIDVDGASDPSLVKVDVEKQGGGAGNGFAAASVAVIVLAFDVQGAGATTLTLVGLGAEPPQAINSTRTPIAAVTFDAESGSVTSVTTTSGGGY